MRHLYTLLLFFCINQYLFGQSNINNFDRLKSPWSLFKENKNQGLYLKTLLQLTQNPQYTDSTSTPISRSSYYDVLVQLYNYFGEYKTAAEMEEKFLNELDLINGSVNETDSKGIQSIISYSKVSALDAIKKMAVNKQVVMINEEHRDASHREFVRQLLPNMYEMGFRYLAVEDLKTLKDTTLNERKYPIRASGSYLHDPVFAAMIRDALSIGFIITGYDFAYEQGYLKNIKSPHPMARENIRDSIAASNIIDKILRNDPNAKVLVYAGRAHVGKFNIDGIGMMAWHFKNLTNIDPLSIDQASMRGYVKEKRENGIYKELKNKIKDFPIVLKDSSNCFWSEQKGFDITIFHPPLKFDNNQPSWLAKNYERIPVEINYTKLGIKVNNGIYRGLIPYVLEVRIKNEEENGIPAQQVLILPRKKEVRKNFYLFPGAYQVFLKDEDGNVISDYDFVVK